LSIKNDSALAYRIARYYYLDNLSQSEIAQIEQISRSTVSRMLDKARASGMVTIDIKMPVSPLIDKLESSLQEALGLTRVIVVPASVNELNETTDETVVQDLASIAATHMTELLKDCKIIGLGWGRTVYSTVGYMPFVEPDSSRLFIPLVSNYSVRNRFLQTSTIVSRYGERFGAQTYYLNISGVKRPEEQRTESEILNIRQLERYWSEMDAAVLSLGAPLKGKNPYHSELAIYSAEGDDEQSERGEMLSQLYFSNGETCWMGRDAEIVAFPLSKLKDVKNVICIAGGLDKAKPILYASKNGYFKTLITDHLTATEMLDALAKMK
jgi:deoxyribonucleoside regulator